MIQKWWKSSIKTATLTSMKILNRHRWLPKFYDFCKAHGYSWRELPAEPGFSSTMGVFIANHQIRRDKTVIFLHGFGNDILFPQVGLFRRLLKDGWSVLTFDLSGHGQDEASTFCPKEFSYVADEILQRAEALIPGEGKWHLVGYSIGAGVLLNFSSRFPSKVASLTMLSMPVELPKSLPFVTELTACLRPSFVEALADYGLAGVFPAFDRFKRGEFPLRLVSGFNGSYVDAARQGISNLQLLNCLNKIEFPALFVAGTRDLLVSTAKMQDLSRVKSNLKVAVLLGETHYTTLLSRKTWDIVADFLSINSTKN